MVEKIEGSARGRGGLDGALRLARVEPARMRAGRPLKIIGREPLSRSIERAVAKALSVHLEGVSRGDVEAIQSRVKAEFLRLIGRNGRRVRGMSRREFLLELDRARDRTLLARDRAREELLELQRDLELARVVQRGAGRAGVDAASRVDLGGLRQGLREILARSSSGEIDGPRLREEILTFTSRVLRQEVDRITAAQAAEFEREVDNLERRIHKLTHSLEETERALGAMARLKNVDPGLASIYRTVQGLSPLDAMLRMKEEMLARLFEANLVLQGKPGV